MNREETRKEDEDEDQYIEEEDDDFDPNAQNDGDDDDFSEDSEDEPAQPKSKKRKLEQDKLKKETEKEVAKANYKSIESSTGGLIKTRSQRQQETTQGKSYNTSLHIKNAATTADIDELWIRLKAQSQERLKHQYSASNIESTDTKQLTKLSNKRQIKIKRKYEYAGEIITEEKWVDVESAEAKAYISTVQDKSKIETNDNKPSTDKTTTAESEAKLTTNDQGQPLRKVYKRPSLLEGIISGAIKPKFNTLEKSRVDFAKFVDKEGINDELQQHGKDGYLAKKDFLSRVELHRDSSFKEMRMKELQNKNK